MMPTDRQYTPGGTNATGGNYTRIDGPKSQVMRLLYLQRGSIAARPDIGTDWDSVSKFDEDIERKLQSIIEEGQAPLVQNGTIRDLSVTVEAVTDYGAGYVLSWVDAKTGDGDTYEGERAWTR
jgi:hypothetical protein